MAVIEGTAQGVDDTLRGTAGDDKISGLSGDDFIVAGRGDDTIIGGQGSDVLGGGLGADVFEWSAGHIGNGDIDWVIDFSLNQGDTLKFRDSGEGQELQILGVHLGKTTETEFNGNDLNNNVALGTDVIFEIYNSVTGAYSTIVLLDAWSGNLSAQWDAYLATMGLSFGCSEALIS